jgi:glucuronate isomerase
MYEAGIVTVTGNPWKETVKFPKPLAMTPDHYVVMLMQSDATNSDGHGEYPPHVEKLDEFGNNQDAGFVGNMVDSFYTLAITQIVHLCIVLLAQALLANSCYNEKSHKLNLMAFFVFKSK